MRIINSAVVAAAALTLVLASTACSPAGSGSAASGSNSRLQVVNQAISVISANGVSSSSAVSAQGLSITPSLTLVATIAPPVSGSTTLQASDITVAGTNVYMGYNVAGDVNAGGIDVISILTPASPSILSEAIYPTTDINKVFVLGTNLYTVGETADGNGGAVLNRIGLNLAGALTSTVATVPLRSQGSSSVSSYAGVSVIANLAYVYAVSGDNGGLSILNASDLSLASFTPINNARDVSFDPLLNGVYVSAGRTSAAQASLERYNLLTGAAVSSYNVAIPNTQIDAGKSTVQTGLLGHLVTAGYGGIELLCLADGSTISAMANPTVSGLTSDLTTANAAAFGNGIVYVANGGAGVAMYAMNRATLTTGCVGLSLTYLGRFSLGDNASANNVYYAGGFLYVATGTGGFNVIQVSQSLTAGLQLSL